MNGSATIGDLFILFFFFLLGFFFFCVCVCVVVFVVFVIFRDELTMFCFLYVLL